MLEKPKLNEEEIVKSLWNDYGLNVRQILFQPLGADRNTAVYRVVAQDHTVYFVKLRSIDFNRASVEVPYFLSTLGIKQIIPPLPTKTGKLWTKLTPFKVVLYPYVEGRDGFEQRLSPGQWVEFGRALKKFHTANIPSSITSNIPREYFSDQWRAKVKMFLEWIDKEIFTEPVAAELASFLKTKKEVTLDLIKRAGRCAQALKDQSPEFILCHADIHAWNLLIDTKDNLYIVDWDTLIFAPKERDLMFIGSGLGKSGYTPYQEEMMFFQGYGQTSINQNAIAYYRFERIIEDIAVICEQILLSNDGEQDRSQALRYLKSNFLPNSTLQRACEADTNMKAK